MKSNKQYKHGSDEHLTRPFNIHVIRIIINCKEYEQNLRFSVKSIIRQHELNPEFKRDKLTVNSYVSEQLNWNNIGHNFDREHLNNLRFADDIIAKRI